MQLLNCSERFGAIWSYIQNVDHDAFSTFVRLSNTPAFSAAASGTGDTTALAEVHQRLRKLGVPLGSVASEEYTDVKIAISAITYRIFEYRGA